MLSPTTKRNIVRMIPFGLLWLIFSFIYTLLEKGLLANLHYYPSTGNPYNFDKNIFATPASALIMGLLIGFLEIQYFSKWFALKSFSKKIIFKSVIYLGLILFFLLANFILTTKNIAAALSTNDFWIDIVLFFSSFSVISVIVYIAAIIVVTQFYTEVSENLGHNVLNNFFTGKYYKPVEEERIFMFLDMRSSTTIAENLGHVKYFEMLKMYFADLSNSIIKFSGEVYQYAGDEIIVSWKIKDGLQKNNCINCYFEMKGTIKKQADKYNKLFGLLPSFKAGLHFGMVTTGEIGTIKKEIIFTGDVLNTTARVQGLCNILKADILLSASLVKKLDLNSHFESTSLGENVLKGKDEKIELFTLSIKE